MVIIHLGCSLPKSSSDLPGNVVRIASDRCASSTKNVSLFGLAPRGVYPAAPVTKRADALLPRRFTHHPKQAGLFSVALVVVRIFFNPNARWLSGSPPSGVRTFLCRFSTKAITRPASLQGSHILTKIVQQLQFTFLQKVAGFYLVDNFNRIPGINQRVGLFSAFYHIQIKLHRREQPGLIDPANSYFFDVDFL